MFHVPAGERDSRRPERSLDKRKAYVAQELLEFCRRYPGVVVVISALLLRESNPQLVNALMCDEPTTLGLAASCYQAAILNGASCLVGRERAVKHLSSISEHCARAVSLKNLDHQVRRLKLSLTADKSRSAEMHRIHKHERMRWLSSQTEVYG